MSNQSNKCEGCYWSLEGCDNIPDDNEECFITEEDYEEERITQMIEDGRIEYRRECFAMMDAGDDEYLGDNEEDLDYKSAIRSWRYTS